MTSSIARREIDWRRFVTFMYIQTCDFEKIFAVDYTETAVEWKQWAVADSESEDDNEVTA